MITRAGAGSYDFYMPWLVADAVRVILRVTDIQVAQVGKTFKFIGVGKCLGKVPQAKISLADIKVADCVIGMSRRRQRVGSPRQVAVNFRRFINSCWC